jgi:phosphoribosyl 1,2-cyclic phosphate phosphodiesterase
MKVTILGCGASPGVPMLGCDCPVCTSADPRNTRMRSSILVESGGGEVGEGTAILVDSGPDVRQQLLRHQILRLDAVLYTHAHADHAHGIDELRALNFLTDGPLDAWADTETMTNLQERFRYIFEAGGPAPGGFWSRPKLIANVIEEPFEIGEIRVESFVQDHGPGRGDTLGFRFGKIAYSTDAWALDEAAFAALEGVDTWIVDCLTEMPNPAHAHLERSLEWIARVRPRRAVLTHMNHRLEYHDLARRLPRSVEPAYDGMVIEV